MPAHLPLPHLLLAALGFSVLSGCSTVSPPDLVVGPNYQASNVHRREPTLPKDLRRVAVLPLTVAREDLELEAGRVALEPVLLNELNKIKRFEVQPVSRSQLQVWTGKPAWSAAEPLPSKFFEKLKEQVGCDGVLFCNLTTYRAYPPLAIGWQLRLVDGGTNPTVWSVDEVFDAGNPAVANGARRYYQQEARRAQPLADSYGILQSPRQFGQYTLSTALGTMPER